MIVLAVTAPIPEGGVTRIQITTNSPVLHKFAPLSVVETFVPVPGGPQAGGHFTILPMAYPVFRPQEDNHFNGPFLHHIHHVLMALGL